MLANSAVTVNPTATAEQRDDAYMEIALRLARRGFGRVWPNPAVGCVVVASDTIVGRGHTGSGGRPHAETVALARAGAAARGATAYVSLEPCCHHGETPPCTDALIEAGIARVVIAVRDPDPRVDGGGVEHLQAAGLAITTGVREAAATELNAGFFSCILAGRPLITAKLATTLDGRIATRTGKSQWITGVAARRRGHLLRATHDAIMVGSGTVDADDPSLTCRLPGLADRSPVRVVVDGPGRMRPDSALAQGAADVPVWCITTERNAHKLKSLGADVSVIACPDGEGQHVDLAQALRLLSARGITRLLVEGGAGLITALLRRGLVDRLVWFRAPMVLGDDALAGLGALELDELPQGQRLRLLTRDTLDHDVLETYALDTIS